MTKVTMIALLIIAILTIFINFGVIIRVIKLLRKGGELKPTFLFIAFVVTACEETICTISLIAIDKYIFICHGISYRGIVTKKRVRISILITWIYSLLIGFLPAMGLHEDDWCACNFTLYINTAFSIVLFLAAVVIPLVIILTLYCIILRLAIKVTKTKLEFSQSNGVSSVFRLSLKMKNSKSSYSTTSTKLSSSNTVYRDVRSSPTKSQRSKRTISIKSSNQNNDLRKPLNEGLKEMPKVISITSSNRCKNSSLPTVVELLEFDFMPQELSTDDEDSEDDSDENVNFRQGEQVAEIHKFRSKEKSYDLSNAEKEFDRKSKSGMTSLNTSDNEDSIQDTENSITEETDEDESPTTASLNLENENHSKDRIILGSNLHYFRKILVDTKDKVFFLQKCRAIKPIFMILLCFILTYVPFVTATLVFKAQEDKNENLFKALNNLLYFAVVLNSLINPFVYAYGYKEFRLKTKNFKGLFAKEKRPVS
ncbi:Alpha-1A adrenergic receptor, partial [Armadillidium vulgare]